MSVMTMVLSELLVTTIGGAAPSPPPTVVVRDTLGPGQVLLQLAGGLLGAVLGAGATVLATRKSVDATTTMGTAEREQRRQEREEEKTAAVLARMERTEERVRDQAEREQQFQREIALRQEEHEREWSERQDHAALERQREAWAALVQALVRCEDLLVQTDSNPAATARYIRVHRWADREDGVMLLRGAIRIHGASLEDDLRERVTAAAVVARNLHRLQPDRVPVDDVYGDAENYERINARVKDLQAYFMYVRMSLDARRRSGSSLPQVDPPDVFRADLTPWPMPLDVPPQELADPLR